MDDFSRKSMKVFFFGGGEGGGGRNPLHHYSSLLLTWLAFTTESKRQSSEIYHCHCHCHIRTCLLTRLVSRMF